MAATGDGVTGGVAALSLALSDAPSHPASHDGGAGSRQEGNGSTSNGDGSAISPSSMHPLQSPLSPRTAMNASLLKPPESSGGAADRPASPSPAGSTATDSKSQKKQQTCEKVLEEIVSTERAYLASLQQVVAVYIKPLRDGATQAELGLKPAQVGLIFANLEGIVGFHAILHEELAACLTSQAASTDAKAEKMATIFNKYGDFLRMYTSYVNNYHESLATLTALQDNKKFQKFLSKCKQNPGSGGMDLMAFLIMPVQRIPRYELLLRELMRQTAPTSSLTAALSKIQEIGQHVNETKRLVDRVADILSVQVKLANSLPHDQEAVFRSGALWAPHRRLIREGELQKRGTSRLASDKSRTHYLFNDLLLWTDSHGRYKSHATLLYAAVEPAHPPLPSAELAFELARYDAQMSLIDKMLLYGASVFERNAWVKDIAAAIAEATELHISSDKDGAGRSAAATVVPERIRRVSDNKFATAAAAEAAAARGAATAVNGHHQPQSSISSVVPPINEDPTAESPTAAAEKGSNGAADSSPRKHAHQNSTSAVSNSPAPAAASLAAPVAVGAAHSKSPSANLAASDLAGSADAPSPTPSPPLPQFSSSSRPTTPTRHSRKPSSMSSASGGTLSRPTSAKPGLHSKQPSVSSLGGSAHSRKPSMAAHSKQPSMAHSRKPSMAVTAAAAAGEGSHSKQSSSGSVPATTATASDATVAAGALDVPAAASDSLAPPAQSRSRRNSSAGVDASSGSAVLVSAVVHGAFYGHGSTAHVEPARPVMPPPPPPSLLMEDGHTEVIDTVPHEEAHAAEQPAAEAAPPAQPAAAAAPPTPTRAPAVPPRRPSLSHFAALAPIAASTDAVAPAASASAVTTSVVASSASAPTATAAPVTAAPSSSAAAAAAAAPAAVAAAPSSSAPSTSSAEDDAAQAALSEWHRASDAINHMSRGDVTALKMIKTPTPNVRAAMECLGALMLDANASSSAPPPTTPRGAAPSAAASAALKKSLHPQTDDWAALQSLWVKPNFLTLLRDFNERAPPVPERVAHRVATLTRDEKMSPAAVKVASSAAGVLWTWLLSYVRMKAATGGDAAATIRPGTASAPSSAAGKAASRPAPASAETERPATARPHHARVPSAKRLSLSSLSSGVSSSLAPSAAPAAAAVSPSKIPSTPRTLAKSASVAEVGGHHRAASTLQAGSRTAIPVVSPAGATTSRPSTASRAGAAGPEASATSPPIKRRLSASSHTMAREELDAMAAMSRAAGAGPAPASRTSLASSLSPLKSAKPVSTASPAGGSPASRPATARKSLAPGSGPSSSAASSASAGEAPKTPRSSIPKASDAAKYVPGGGGVKIFSEKVDFSKVKSKVPGAAEATHVAKKSDVKIVSHKIDLSNVHAKVPGHVTAPPVAAAASAEKGKKH